VKPQSFLRVCRSEWQTPQYRIFTLTSSSPFSLQKIKIKIKIKINHVKNYKDWDEKKKKKKRKEKNLREKWKGESVPEVSLAAQPKALSGSSVSGDFAIDLSCYYSLRSRFFLICEWSSVSVFIDLYGRKKERKSKDAHPRST
jgi:hypothetical protein